MIDDLYHRYVDHHGELTLGELTIPVLILDVRHVWNRTDLRITPRYGTGQQWVAADRVHRITDPNAKGRHS